MTGRVWCPSLEKIFIINRYCPLILINNIADARRFRRQETSTRLLFLLMIDQSKPTTPRLRGHRRYCVTQHTYNLGLAGLSSPRRVRQ